MDHLLHRLATKHDLHVVQKTILHAIHGHCKTQKPVLVRLLVVVRPQERMKETRPMDPIELGQIALGFRVPVDFTPDKAVDLRDGVNYASVTVDSGDSTASVAPGSTPTSFRAYFNGDGALGLKSATIAADGHIGDGDVEITQRVNWEVISTDATTFTNVVGPAEPIPTVVPPTDPVNPAARRR